MLSTLYLLRFNNYYNRILKRYDTLAEYEQYTIGQPLRNVNFIPNDGVHAKQVVNWNYDIPDYLLVVEGTDSIVSRWFVIEAVRNLKGQFELTLFRDTLADYLENIRTAPMFVEKAILENSNPLIFNQEDMTFNQIKTSENLITDETKSAWLVGYCARDTDQTDISAEVKFNAPADIAVTNITAYEYYNNSNLVPDPQPLSGFPSKVIYNVYSKFRPSYSLGQDYINKISFNKNGKQTTGNYVYDSLGNVRADSGATDVNQNYAFLTNGPKEGTTWPFGCTTASYRLVDETSFNSYNLFVEGFRGYYTTLESQLPAYLPIKSQEQTLDIENQDGKTIYDSTNDKYYQVTVTKQTLVESEIMITSGAMYNTFIDAMNNVANTYDTEWSWREPGEFYREVWGGSPNSGCFSVRTIGTSYSITLTQLPDQALKYNVEFPNDRYTLEDAPYDMFCMPYSDDLDIYKNQTIQFKASKTLAFQTFMSLATKYKQAGFIYDIQLLPYCPVRYCIKQDGTFDIGNNIVAYVTQTENNITTNVGVVLFGTKSSFDFNVPYTIEINDPKIESQTDIYRLCSPNYAGQFEFNAAKNNGVESIAIDCTYKPYTPYIHLNPNFKNLYGGDFNDARGLICGGDYSLPAVSSAWDTYELQNKNYQLAFDRQIQNMEVQNKYQRTMDIANAITGVVGGGVTGGIAGSAGGPWGAVAGAVVGTVGSTITGIMDVSMKEGLRNEAIDYAKDQFGYQLGNIQALPYTLNKVSAFNANNKIFPFIEYYTCTDIEKQAFRDKIKYNGMTVMAIGTMEEYINNKYQENPYSYIKGKIIRLEGIEDDFHITNVIAGELYKGVFI